MEQTIGKRIVQNRKKLGLTQEQLAERLGVTAQAVSKWENDLSCPDISVLPILADVFAVTIDELLGRSNAETVFNGEVIVEEDSQDEDSKRGTFELTWDGGKKNAIAAAAFVIFSGFLYLLSQILVWDTSFWDILWPSALIFFGAMGLAPKFSFLRLGCLLLGAYFLIGKLFYIPIKLDSGIVFAVIVILFGGSLLMDALKKSKKQTFNVSYTDKFGKVHHGKMKTDFEYTDQTFHYNSSFSSTNQAVLLDTLKSGSISTSFGEYTIDLTHIQNVTEDCTLNISCSFGELTILVPRHIGIQLENNTSFAEIHTDGFADPAVTGIMSIAASASFAEIVIKYV